MCGLAYNQLTKEQWEVFRVHWASMDGDLGVSKYLRPAIHLHVYGVNDEGYWTANHMVAMIYLNFEK